MVRLGSMFCRHCQKYHRSSELCDCDGARAERFKPYADAIERMKHASNEAATLAIGEPLSPSDPPTVIIGLPDTVWLKFQSGQTVDFDLRNAGVFANLIIMRAKDGADVARQLGHAQAVLDGAPFAGIEKGSTQ